MSFFSSITSTFKTNLSKAVNIAKAVSPVVAVASIAKQTIQASSQTGTQKTATQTAIKAQVVKTTATAIGYATGGVLKAVPGATSTVVKAIGSVIIKHPIATAVTVVASPSLVAIGKEVAKKPEKVIDLAEQQTSFTEGAIEVLKNPTGEAIQTFVGEHPAGTAILAGATALGVIGATKGLAGNLLLYKALGSDDITVEQPNNQLLPEAKATNPSIVPTNTEVPKTPATVPVYKTSTTVRKHKKQAKISPQTQSMRVNIYNQSKVLNSHCIRSNSYGHIGRS